MTDDVIIVDIIHVFQTEKGPHIWTQLRKGPKLYFLTNSRSKSCNFRKFNEPIPMLSHVSQYIWCLVLGLCVELKRFNFRSPTAPDALRRGNV